MLGVQLCTGQRAGPSVGLGQRQDPANHCKVREGNHSGADRRPVGVKKADTKDTTQEYPDVLSELCSTSHCRINSTVFKEFIWTKYSKVFPRMVIHAKCLSKNAFRIKRSSAANDKHLSCLP